MHEDFKEEMIATEALFLEGSKLNYSKWTKMHLGQKCIYCKNNDFFILMNTHSNIHTQGGKLEPKYHRTQNLINWPFLILTK